MTEATAHAVAAEYSYSNLNGTATYISHSGTAIYKTHEAGQEEFGCVCKVLSTTMISNNHYHLLITLKSYQTSTKIKQY